MRQFFKIFLFSSFLMASTFGEAACLTPSYGAPVAAIAPLKVDGQYFKDRSGKTVLLRGFNVGSKVPPFRGITDASQLDQLKVWGVNTIRLLFNWEAYEGMQCQYDKSYLDYYEQVTQWAAARGIYVLVDFHQDTYSRFSNAGCGEGFPAWTVPAEVAKSTPDNSATCQYPPWGVRAFFDQGFRQTWKSFHNDQYGVKTAYINIVKSVANVMAKHGNVIGYDIMNEPWGLESEMTNLYDKASAVIRNRHPSAIIFYEPSTDASFIEPPRYVDASSVSRAYENIVWAPHYYDSLGTTFSTWTGNLPDATLDGRIEEAIKNNSGIFLGEMGMWAKTANVSGYMDSLYDYMDRRFMSGVQWGYTPIWNATTFDGWNTEDFSVVANGELRSQLYYPRAYPRKTAGTPASFSRGATAFSYSWQNDPAVGITEIFLPAGYNYSQVEINTFPYSLQCAVQSSSGSTVLNCNSPEKTKVSVNFALRDPLKNGVIYKLTNKNTGLAMDVKNVSVQPGESVHQWQYIGAENQKWKAVSKSGGNWNLVSMNSGLCLAVQDQSTQNGQKIIQQTCSDSDPSQNIHLVYQGTNDFNVVFGNSYSCLDDNNWSKGNGAWLQQWPCNSQGQANQEWAFQVVQ